MHVTVTGAGGFIGRRVVRELIRRGTIADAQGSPIPITKIIAADLSLKELPANPLIERVEADTSEPSVQEKIISGKTRAVFHLAAVVSVGAEEDFDLGMRVNLDTTRALLETCRKTCKGASFLFASSAAVYGGELPREVADDFALAPQTSYGCQKAICEILINDYSRKGFVDGRTLRLPTIVVRPGKPNKAASTFASSIIRDPLQGGEAICPVPTETAMCLLSPKKVVESFLHAQTIPAQKWGYTRVVQLPGLKLTIHEMLADLEKIAGKKVSDRVKFENDPRIEKIVAGWPARFKAEKALRLDFSCDNSMREIIQDFIDDDLNGKFVA